MEIRWKDLPMPDLPEFRPPPKYSVEDNGLFGLTLHEFQQLATRKCVSINAHMVFIEGSIEIDAEEYVYNKLWVHVSPPPLTETLYRKLHCLQENFLSGRYKVVSNAICIIYFLTGFYTCYVLLKITGIEWLKNLHPLYYKIIYHIYREPY